MKRPPIDDADDNRLLELESWFQSAFGAYVLGFERELLDARLPELYGFHLMQLGICRAACLFESSVIRHKFMLGRLPGSCELSAITESESLPIESDCVDVVILHHTLEYSQNPHQLLREASRIVAPHGHLLIVGFNPISLFGLRSLVSRHTGQQIWRSRLLGAGRVTDWLTLLDFAVDSIRYAVHAVPISHGKTLAKMAGLEALARRWSLPCGAVYLIHARKQISPLIPVKPLRWRSPVRVPALPLATRGTLH